MVEVRIRDPEYWPRVKMRIATGIFFVLLFSGGAAYCLTNQGFVSWKSVGKGYEKFDENTARALFVLILIVAAIYTVCYLIRYAMYCRVLSHTFTISSTRLTNDTTGKFVNLNDFEVSALCSGAEGFWPLTETVILTGEGRKIIFPFDLFDEVDKQVVRDAMEEAGRGLVSLHARSYQDVRHG